MFFYPEQGSCGCFIPGSIQCLLGQGLEHPAPVQGVPAHGRGTELDDLYGPFQPKAFDKSFVSVGLLCFVLVDEAQRQDFRTPKTAVELPGEKEIKAFILKSLGPFFPTWRDQVLLLESSKEHSWTNRSDVWRHKMNLPQNGLQWSQKKKSIEKKDLPINELKKRSAYKWSNERSYSSVK